MSIPLDTIYSYFETGDFPTQEEFKESWSSFWHKDEPVPANKIAGLDSLLQNKVDKNKYELHLEDANAHASILAKRDASNLNSDNVKSWKTKLEVGNLPANLATVDDYDELGNISGFGNVFTKDQSNDIFMSYGDYTDNNGNILAEKIEALGLTTLIEAVETTISDFANHSDAYVFEDNDFIAIPVNKDNYSLYMFKGGAKNNKGNYLPTGLSNITIGMVEGLQSELNKIQVVQDHLTNLNNSLQTKADKVTVQEQLSSVNINLQTKADKAAVLEQFNALNGDLQTKVDKATVYTKDQSDSKYMFLQDFLNDDKKILAEKIEALGLTTLIEASEKSILEFAERSDLYKFEDNDFIAVPDSKGNFSLYLFKGGDKRNKANYLATGLSNITVGMVEGLQSEINKIEVVQGELINVNTKLQIKADKAAVFEQFGTFTTSLATKADRAAVELELNKIKIVEDGLVDVNANLQIKADKATVLEQLGTFTTSLQTKADKAEVELELNKIKIVEEGLTSVNENLQIKADKATVLEQLGTFTNSLATKADKSTLQQEVNRIKVVEDGLIDVNADLQIKADKNTVLEQFNTLNSNLETKVDLETAQAEFNKIKLVENGVTSLNLNLQTKADKNTIQEQFNAFNSNLETKVDLEAAQEEFNKIKLVENGVASLNINLQTKADKAAVLEQISELDADIKVKADKATVELELSKIKVIEDGLVDVNTKLQIKADKATVLEQFGTFTTSLATKADKSTLQQEVNRIKVVEDGLVDVNADLLIKADKATVLEQFNTLNTSLETKVDLETAQVEFNKIKLVEGGVASLNLNLQNKADKATVLEQINALDAGIKVKADKATVEEEFIKIKLVEDGVASLNLNLQTKADKSTIQEQFNAFNSDLETKVDLETAQVEFNKIKLVENEVATVKSNLEIKADKNTLENHVWSSDSHVSYLTRRDASNLDSKNIYDWQRTLGILDSTEPRRNYKIYRALLHVDEKSYEPQFIVLENTIGDIFWRREETGFYTGSLEKAFPEGKVWINSKINIPFKRSFPIDCMSIRLDDNVIGLNVFTLKDETIPIDMVGNFGNIEIYVYDVEK
ncbi:hypothetical protein [Chryseobacterium sp. 18068]|uniref:hypothetical protein n=1 Tax=Chryseobacterium sp. 18068 TaxID=2681414 RepID=UPI00135A9994|nr:hypothetical protein [Chryseobacterium sp. 18068]